MKAFKNFLSNLLISIDYLKSDLIKNQSSFRIGLISIFLVVFFLTLIFNVIQLSPCIFIKLSEEQNGEIDLILTPYLQSQNVQTKKSIFEANFYNKSKITYSNISNINNSTIFNHLNFYDIKKKLSNLSFIEGFAPRWVIKGKASYNNNEKNISNEFSTNILILDSSLEKDIGLGRQINFAELNMGECYISETLKNALKVKIDDIIQMEIKLSDLFKTISSISKSNNLEFYSFSYNNEEEYRYHGMKKFKRYNGILKDDFEKADNSDNDTNNFDNLKINLNLGNIFDDKNKIKDIKNAILQSGPVKEIINSILNEYIKINIINTIKVINGLLPTPIKMEDLPSFKFNRSYLKDPLIKDVIYIKEFNKILFPEEYEENKGKEENKFNKKQTFLKKLAYSLIRKIFYYEKKTDLIYIDKKAINTFYKGNLTDFIEENINFNEMLEEELIFDNITKFINIKLNLKIKNKIKSDEGKWPNSLGNVVAIDSRNIKDYLILNSKRILEEILYSFKMESMEKVIWKSLEKYINAFDIYKYSFTINAVFKNKLEIYKKDNKDLRHYISKISGEITSQLGENYKVIIKTPIYSSIEGFSVLKIFLEDIFFGVMIFLWVLCVLLVYSLMLGNIDEKSYEFGMLRALGLEKAKLTYLIILKGFIFSIPGIILGLSSSYIANNFIAFLFNLYCHFPMPFFLSKTNIVFGISVGLSIPIISSYFPIKKCLESNLRDALSLFNNKKIGDIIVSMIKLENLGISPSMFIGSITLIIIGTVTYYLAPLSYIFNNLSLFLFIMICILISMVLGLIILFQLIVPYIQDFILKIIMFLSYKDRKFHLLILRNLDCHKRRNRQISLMLLMVLGFIIFSGCTLNLIVDIVERMAKGLIAGDFSVYLFDKELTLNEKSINSYLQNITKNHPNVIKNYSYYSFYYNDLISNNNFSLITKFGSLNGYPLIKKPISGVGKNYIDSSYSSLYGYTDYDKNLNISFTSDHDKVDIIKMLYDNPNIEKVLQEKNNSFIFPKDNSQKTLKDFQLNIFIAEGIKKIFGVNVDEPARITFIPSSKDLPQLSIPCKIVGLLNKLPGINTYSSYKTFAASSIPYVSLDQLKELYDLQTEIYNIKKENLSNSTLDGIRKKRFILKYNDNVSKELKDMVYFGMKNYIEGLNVFSIQLAQIINTIVKIKKVIEYILLVLGIIGLILSSFLICISFYNNIRENIVEYGIYRSIGVTKSQSVRIYLYEALAIIITSIIIGTFVGVVISSLFILQFDIFLELPFIFNFPYKLYIILVISGFLLGLLGSYFPTYAVNSLSLVKIMKGFN